MTKKRILLTLFLIIMTAGVLVVAYIFFRAPTISVVMPTYNREYLLPRAIESIQNQTFKDFEFIIVDDGSTDNSVQLIQAYQATDKRIKLIQNEKNCGISCSRNRGMEAARGRYLAIMDSDDYSEPKRLEKSLKFFKKHPDYTAVNSIYFEMEKESHGANNWVPPRRWEIIFNFANYYTNLAVIDLKFVRKHNLKYDESLISAEDYDFWANMLLAGGKLGMINEPLIHLRRHATHKREYYENITNMRKVISAKLLSRFGVSKEDAYEENRCKIMEQMIEANLTKKIVDQYSLEFTYKLQCTPEKLSHGSIYIKHFDFIDSFVPVGNDVYMRVRTKQMYKKVKYENRILTLINPDGEVEEYYWQNDGTYAYIENLE